MHIAIFIYLSPYILHTHTLLRDIYMNHDTSDSDTCHILYDKIHSNLYCLYMCNPFSNSEKPGSYHP